ncbi:1,4-alpha-glucan branching enzyme [Endobacter medicaginis]|uniref:1,4-alpha-glucan branching enzyme GlgB n=1 Tax=Endobacter medicaginis TaxID=1181271 RepID=A0A850NT01_9PROT|nr:1,4-alpha-glucan branching protein GlgB [Endobacter medicaginis]MBB3174200.1 1,4-alpha-glucan branching enzyme [Endobacter medicaginis]MCX5474245.1 1,4-alpha-glucan branching protein GlgB [Endobacter medicaginis]NVN30058.1 1,4-alpha-glucan branching protein GlgB [Endobacter medicaginis]
MNELTAASAVDTPHPAAIDSLLAARHGDPFSLLGPHPVEGGLVVRAFLPGAASVEVIARATSLTLSQMTRVRPEGLFSARIPADQGYRLRVDDGAGVVRVIDDPYAFGPSLGDLDVYLLAEGRHRRLGEVLGAHPMTIADRFGDAVAGTRFAVWAPNAQRVSVVGDFNAWDGRTLPMRKRVECGVWELFVPGVGPGALYKYELVGPSGELLPLRADPCAWAAQKPPQTASIVAALTPKWSDGDWMANRGAHQAADAPISIYEMHATSWLPGGEAATTDWDALADRLLPYITELGFTHIELMPIMEHPFGGSWGYQPLGQFAPNSRLGPPEGFARFVDRAHNAGIGIILDWVPAHFPTDAHGLARFDGTALYEHEDPREGFHQDWNTLIYNLGRNEVRGFMIASALFWLEHYHVDGLRVDAVASMLYRDYSRKDGEWVPNRYGGRENLESIAFLQDLSRAVREDAPGAVLIAEESTAFPGVTRPADEGGLGFDFKWNMGWMHDTLHYIEQPPIYRKWAHGEISFGLVYAFSERFVLPLSHDEVVYGKGSMIGKMPGDHWQRFANLRAYYGFMWGHPGKKLLFMGGEFAQWREWNHDAGLDWGELDRPEHRGMQALIGDLNAAYRAQPGLHRRDPDGAGFTWLKLHDSEASVFAWLRRAEDGRDPVLVVCNFTPVPRHDYRIGVPLPGRWVEILNTDAERYGGSNVGNSGSAWADGPGWDDQPHSLALTLPPLATLYLAPERHS